MRAVAITITLIGALSAILLCGCEDSGDETPVGEEAAVGDTITITGSWSGVSSHDFGMYDHASANITVSEDGLVVCSGTTDGTSWSFSSTTTWEVDAGGWTRVTIEVGGSFLYFRIWGEPAENHAFADVRLNGNYLFYDHVYR